MVKGGNSKKVWERDTLWVNQPFEPKGPDQGGKKISDGPKSEPKGIDGSQESIKVSKRNLEKKNEDDSNGDENGENKSFWQGDSESLKNCAENNPVILPLPYEGEDWGEGGLISEVHWPHHQSRLTTILKHGKKKGNNLFETECRRSSCFQPQEFPL